ncbi:unnamed protein product [Hymenolepis diminuta]|uniref:Uncharacterized protein n=1 Tax=Hymenolepis diminuta TaxID=6216 RepID=A0A564ZDI0_HYMDI|nr:unnamed protein product [Hymenolepis diminuta]
MTRHRATVEQHRLRHEQLFQHQESIEIPIALPPLERQLPLGHSSLPDLSLPPHQVPPTVPPRRALVPHISEDGQQMVGRSIKRVYLPPKSTSAFRQVSLWDRSESPQHNHLRSLSSSSHRRPFLPHAPQYRQRTFPTFLQESSPRRRSNSIEAPPRPPFLVVPSAMTSPLLTSLPQTTHPAPPQLPLSECGENGVRTRLRRHFHLDELRSSLHSLRH